MFLFILHYILYFYFRPVILPINGFSHMLQIKYSSKILPIMSVSRFHFPCPSKMVHQKVIALQNFYALSLQVGISFIHSPVPHFTSCISIKFFKALSNYPGKWLSKNPCNVPKWPIYYIQINFRIYSIYSNSQQICSPQSWYNSMPSSFSVDLVTVTCSSSSTIILLLSDSLLSITNYQFLNCV